MKNDRPLEGAKAIRMAPEIEHDRALDGLRGIAIVLVLLMHSVWLEPTRALWGAVNATAEAGWIGVDLFFVLSGFLITRILLQLREAPNRMAVFYGRRALRILPAYFLYLLVATSLLLAFAAPVYVDLTRDMLPWLMVFAQNYYGLWSEQGVNHRALSHLWSLAVEEQFYLVWPFLVWRLKTEQLPRAALACLGFALACKLALALLGAPTHAVYVATFTRIDGFAAGAWIAARLALGAPILPRRMRALPWLAAATLIVTLIAQRSGWPQDIWMMALCTALTPWIFGGLLWHTLTATPRGLWRQTLSQPALVFFGRHSYALYLVHTGVAVALQAQLWPLLKVVVPGNPGRLLFGAAIWLVSIVAALLVDRLVDARMRRLKSRLRPAAAIPASASSDER